MQVGRVADDGTLFARTYLGCVPTGISIAVQTGDQTVILTVQYDAQSESGVPAAVTPDYPSGRKYRWDYSKIQINAGRRYRT